MVVHPAFRAKRSLQTDGNGIPIGLAVCAANTHDKRLVNETLDSQQVFPQEHEVILQRMCLDKSYDYLDVLETIVQFGYEPHVLARGEERKRKRTSPGYRARRWVCEPERGLILYRLPPYSPELNAIEHLWRKLKHQLIPSTAWETIDKLARSLMKVLKRIGTVRQLEPIPAL